MQSFSAWGAAILMLLSARFIAAAEPSNPSVPPRPLVPANAGVTNEAAVARLPEKIKAMLAEPLPPGVRSLAIAEAKVESIISLPFCGGQGEKCGKNPTCDHYPTRLVLGNFAVTDIVLTANRGYIPRAWKEYENPPGATKLKSGDRVWIVCHVPQYHHLVRMVLIEKMPPPPPKGPDSATPPAAAPNPP